MICQPYHSLHFPTQQLMWYQLLSYYNYYLGFGLLRELSGQKCLPCKYKKQTLDFQEHIKNVW